jgi:hypothetical protein
MAPKRNPNVERRSRKDRRSGVDTRTEEEKKAVGERRSGIDRRSVRIDGTAMTRQKEAREK